MQLDCMYKHKQIEKYLYIYEMVHHSLIQRQFQVHCISLAAISDFQTMYLTDNVLIKLFSISSCKEEEYYCFPHNSCHRNISKLKSIMKLCKVKSICIPSRRKIFLNVNFFYYYFLNYLKLFVSISLIWLSFIIDLNVCFPLQL